MGNLPKLGSLFGSYIVRHLENEGLQRMPLRFRVRVDYVAEPSMPSELETAHHRLQVPATHLKGTGVKCGHSPRTFALNPKP